MSRPDSREWFALLADRADLLAELRGGDATAAELTSRLPVSRSTVDRALRELDRAGLVETVDGRYRLSLPGRVALAAVERFHDQLDDIRASAGVIEPLGADAPIDPAVFEGGETVVDGDAPLDRLTSLVEGASAIRGAVSAALPAQVDAYHRQVVDDGVPVELVATAAVVERLVTAFRPQLAEAYRVGDIEIRSVDVLPYSLVVFESPTGPTATLVTYSDAGLTGLVCNDSPAAVAWARETIDRWWADATPLPASRVDRD